MKSKSTWNTRRPLGIVEVVIPRALVYSGTCHQWLSGGASAIRTLPTIWTHRWRVSIVGPQSCQGSSGQGSLVSRRPERATVSAACPASSASG